MAIHSLQRIASTAAVVLFAAAASAAEPRVLGVVDDFAGYDIGPVQKGHVDHWRWSDAEREQARAHSVLEIIAGSAGAKRLHVKIDGDLPKSQRALALLRLAPHFPPEADFVQLRCEVIQGEAPMFIGGPTAYYADSDVYSDGRRLRARDGRRAVEVAFSLNHPMCRNFRRAGFSADAQRVYYTRWAQEPIGIFINPPSQPCEFYIDRVELLSTGEGRPFPVFAAGDVQAVRTIADFEDGRLDRAFNLYMAAGETEWFDESWKRERPLRFAPAKLSIAADDANGTKSLVCVGRYAEEVYCTGVHVDRADVADANALRIALTHDAPTHRNKVVGLGRAEPIDILVFTAPVDRPFAWDEFGPSDALRKGPGPGFDYHLSHRVIAERQDLDFAIYQARRFVRPGERTTLIVPIADFACVYGSGKRRNDLLLDAAPKPQEIIAVAWLTPWCRVGGRDGDVTTRVDDLALVQVPGTAAEHRSFWRVVNWQDVFWSDEDAAGPRRIWRMYLRSDGAPQLGPGP